MSQTTNPFNLVNNDVLLQILEELKLAKCLNSFSMTSKWLREASMPILFNVCHQQVQYPSTKWDIIPEKLWPYIRTLHFKCVCPPLRAFSRSVHDYDTEYPPTDPVICEAFHHWLTNVEVRQMSRLTEVVFDNCRYIAVHGISCRTFLAILTIPNLRHFAIKGLRICPTTHGTIDWEDWAQSPTLSSFRYHVRDPTPTRSFPAEEGALDAVVRAFHSSLETLVLPAEPAPIQLMSSLNWSQLQELRLRGLRWMTPSIPAISLFACMPHLRTLALQLYEPEHVHARAVWPRGFSAVYPWAALDYIHISHPDADDEIYAHLPPTLGGLALRSWPHLCVQLMNKMRCLQSELLWNFPTALPSTLLNILRRCSAQNLHTLELEYAADDPGADAELLQYIAASFPLLRTLELHRSRKSHPSVPTAEIAHHLAPLTHLTTLKLYLDFPDTPLPVFYPLNNRYGAPDSVSRRETAHRATLESAAAVFANALSPALREIWLLTYTDHIGAIWIVFVPIRGDEGAGSRVTVERQYTHTYLSRL